MILTEKVPWAIGEEFKWVAWGPAEFPSKLKKPCRGEVSVPQILIPAIILRF